MSVKLPTIHYIRGERFNVTVLSGGAPVLVWHRQWSLCGMGQTVAEALEELEAERVGLALVMKDDRREGLSDEAWKMREYVMSEAAAQ